MAKGKIIAHASFFEGWEPAVPIRLPLRALPARGKARLETSSYEHDDKKSANSITSGFPFPLKEALPRLSASPVFPPACVPCSPLPNILISGRKKRHGFDPGLAAPPRRHTYFKGYFQTEQYFLHCREQLGREFRLKTPLTPENARILEDIRSRPPPSHIRRTDYLSNPYLSPPPLEYYLPEHG